MKLASKFTLAFLAALAIVLLLYGYGVSRREIRAFDEDRKHDQSVLANALAMATANLWQHRGEPGVMDFLATANRREQESGNEVRWAWVDPSHRPASAPAMPPEILAALRHGEQVTWVNPEIGRYGRRFTAVPVSVPADRLGAIEVGESLESEHLYNRTTSRNILLTTAVVAGISALLAMLLGIRLVGRPVDMLISRARAVAAGDLTTHLRFRQHDELRELAEELNGMCDQLAAARQKVAAETAARIAALEQLRHADRLKTVGQLASGIAHELGTPLNVIRARGKMIATRDAADDESAANAVVIVEQSDRIIGIIRQLLDFARPRSPRKSRADIRQVVDKTLSLLASIAHKRQAQLEVMAGPSPLLAEVDPDKLQQVLSNLVLNAIQAMPSGGVVTVTLGREHACPPADHTGPEGDYIRIDVRDQGEGISEENLPRLFEPFFTTKPPGAGTGLGLSVSRDIVHEHGGWISVDSRGGVGSCFSVFLPLSE